MDRENGFLTSNFLIQYLIEHDVDDEDQIKYLLSTLLRSNEAESSRRPKKKHVGVQTTPEVEATYFPWLLEIEKKTEEFCTELNNLLNSFYNSFREETKRTVYSQRTKSMYEELKRFKSKCQDSKIENTQKYKDRATAASCSVGPSHTQAVTMLKEIENRLKSVLKSATEIRNSIPVIDLETVAEKKSLCSSSDIAEKISYFNRQKSAELNSQKAGQQRIFQAHRSHTALPPAENKAILEKNRTNRFRTQKTVLGCEKSVASSTRPKNFAPERTVPPANMPNFHKGSNSTQGKTLNKPSGSDAAKNHGAIPKNRAINHNIPKIKVGQTSRKPNPDKNNQKPIWR